MSSCTTCTLAHLPDQLPGRTGNIVYLALPPRSHHLALHQFSKQNLQPPVLSQPPSCETSPSNLVVSPYVSHQYVRISVLAIRDYPVSPTLSSQVSVCLIILIVR
uniref:Uncharacterized protein n=1 Tax=Knipowitschia caucasica TaxID=637954 RepID=A0AAV2L2K8_KNICA